MIQSLARRLVALLTQRDPLSERVHLGKGARRRRRPRSASSPARPAASAASSPRPMQPATREARRGRHQPAPDRIAAAPPAARSTRRCASCRAAQRDAMFEIYSFCRAVDDIADSSGPRPERLAQLGEWRDEIDDLYQGKIGAEGRRPRRPGAHIRSRARGFPRRHRRHGDGRRARTSARRASPRSTSIATAWRARSGGCRCASSASSARRRQAARRIISAAPAAHQHPARPRRGCRHRPALSAARGARPGRHRHHRSDRPRCAARTSSQACAPLVERARTHFVEADAIMARCPRRTVKAPRIMGEVYRVDPRRHGRARLERAAPARARLARRGSPGSCCATRSSDAAHHPHHRRRPRRPCPPRSSSRTRGETRRRARGDRRSPAAAAAPITIQSLGMTIDNGNHLLLSGNHAALAYLRAHRRARTGWSARRRPSFPFFDLASQRALDAALQRRPPAVVDLRSRAARARHARARLPAAGAPAVGATRPRGRRGRALHRPALRAAGAAAAAGRAQHRAVGRLGGAGRRRDPRDARRRRPGLPAADRARGPRRRAGRAGARLLARAQLRRSGSGISCIAMRMSGHAASRRSISATTASRSTSDDAVDPGGAALCGGRAGARPRRRRPNSAPSSTRISASTRRPTSRRSSGVLNAHHRMGVRLPGPGLGHHQRRRPADRHAARRAGADDLARGRRRRPGCPPTLPPWQIVRERRATFAATPEQDARRPGAADALGAICSWPAIGQIPACPPRSKVPFDPGAAPPISSRKR